MRHVTDRIPIKRHITETVICEKKWHISWWHYLEKGNEKPKRSIAIERHQLPPEVPSKAAAREMCEVWSEAGKAPIDIVIHGHMRDCTGRKIPEGSREKGEKDSSSSIQSLEIVPSWHWIYFPKKPTVFLPSLFSGKSTHKRAAWGDMYCKRIM